MQTAGGVHLAAHSLQVGAPTLPQALRVRMVFGEMSCLTPFREYREQRPKLHEIASWHVCARDQSARTYRRAVDFRMARELEKLVYKEGKSYVVAGNW